MQAHPPPETLVRCHSLSECQDKGDYNLIRGEKSRFKINYALYSTTHKQLFPTIKHKVLLFRRRQRPKGKDIKHVQAVMRLSSSQFGETGKPNKKLPQLLHPTSDILSLFSRLLLVLIVRDTWRNPLRLCDPAEAKRRPPVIGPMSEKEASKLFLFRGYLSVHVGACVKPCYPELQTINGCVRTKQEVGVAQGDRLLSLSLARAET